MNDRRPIAFSLLAALLACSTAATAPAKSPAAAAKGAAAALHRDGLDLAGMDRAVAPGDDFFAYANGAWIKNTQIPPDRSSYGVGATLAELTAKRTAGLIAETAKAEAPAGSDARKIGDYYATFMDDAGIETKGLAPLKPALDEIAALSNPRELAHAL